MNFTDDAIDSYTKAIDYSNQKKPDTFYNLGNAYCIKQDFKNAIRAYKSSVNLDPNNALALFNLGNAYYMTN